MVDNELADQINSGERRERTEFDEVILGGRSIPASSMQATDTSRFEGKMTFGDYSKDSDDLMSSWILSNLSGGALTSHHVEGATDNRYRWGTAWTFNAEQIALPPRVEKLSFHQNYSLPDVDGQGPVTTPMIQAFNRVYLATGRAVNYVTSSPFTLDGYQQAYVGQMEGRPLEPGHLVTSNMFAVPTNAGVHFIHRDGTIEQASDPPIIAEDIAMWDGKLFALQTSGHVRVYHPSDDTWDPPSEDMRVPPDEGRMWKVTEFYDRAGDPTLAISTRRRIWMYDANNQTLHPSSISVPHHHNNGQAFTSWRDDAVYYATGLGVMRYTRDGIRTDVGLDRDDGVPPEVMGEAWTTEEHQFTANHAIYDMAASYNYLIASAVFGYFQEEHDGTDGYKMSSAIMGWNESGWAPLADTSTFNPADKGFLRFAGNVLVTDTVGGYRLWWGESVARIDPGPWGPDDPIDIDDPAFYTIEIPRAFHSPRHRIMNQVTYFAPTAYVDTGWFDSGMAGFEKTFSHLEIDLATPDDDRELQGRVEVLYRTKGDPNQWHPLGTADTYGKTFMPFGVDDTGFSAGVTDYAIEFRLILHTDEPTQTPIIESLILKYIKLPLEGRAWLAHVDLDRENLRGLGPREIDEYLSQLTYRGGFSKFLHGDRETRVRIAQHQVVEGTGDMPFKQAAINIIEVPIQGWGQWKRGE